MSRVYAVVHRTYIVHARSYQRTHRTCAASSSATTRINFWHQHATIARAPDTTAIVKFFLATPALLLTDYAFNNYAYAVLRSDFLMISFLILTLLVSSYVLFPIQTQMHKHRYVYRHIWTYVFESDCVWCVCMFVCVFVSRISAITVLLPGANQQQIRLSKCRVEKVKILLKQQQRASWGASTQRRLGVRKSGRIKAPE